MLQKIPLEGKSGSEGEGGGWGPPRPQQDGMLGWRVPSSHPLTLCVSPSLHHGQEEEEGPLRRDRGTHSSSQDACGGASRAGFFYPSPNPPGTERRFRATRCEPGPTAAPRGEGALGLGPATGPWPEALGTEGCGWEGVRKRPTRQSARAFLGNEVPATQVPPECHPECLRGTSMNHLSLV